MSYLDPLIQRRLEDIPEDESKSRLEPYRSVILRWRRQGRSYRRIGDLLKENAGVQISYRALYEFVQRRSRPRKIECRQEPDQRRLMEDLRRKPVALRDERKLFTYNPNEPLILEKKK